MGRQSNGGFISACGRAVILNVLLAPLEPGDEVLMTDPLYVGLIKGVRLVSALILWLC